MKPDTEPAIRVEALTHRYPAGGRRRRRAAGAGGAAPLRDALQNISLDIQAGEIFGILGPNGGGKTTLFRIIATLLHPSEGEVRVFGHEVQRDAHQVRSRIGVVFQMPSLDVQLSAAENLRHHGHLYGLRGHDLEDRIRGALEQVSLVERAGDRVATFSGGMRRRIELAKVLLNRPRLLVLDEPSTGLDPGARREMWQHLEGLRREHGVTVVLTTHLMEEADRCDRLAIISRGRLVAVDTPGSLKSRIGGDVITLRLAPDAALPPPELCRRITEAFAPWPSGQSCQVVDDGILIERPDGAAFVARLAPFCEGQVQSITVGRPTLDDVFTHLTGGRLAEDEAA